MGFACPRLAKHVPDAAAVQLCSEQTSGLGCLHDIVTLLLFVLAEAEGQVVQDQPSG